MSRSITLGAKYKDTITGFEGVATARCHYLSGCDHIQLATLVDGAVREFWFDMPRLCKVGRKGMKVTKPRKTSPVRGGPVPPPPGRSVPPTSGASE